MRRVPSLHGALFGLHGRPISMWGHGLRTYATPRFASIVVKG